EPARPDLQPDPYEQEPERRDLADEDDPEEDQGQHTGAGEKDEVRAEDAGDGAARADVGDARPGGRREVESDRRLRGHRGDPGGEIPEQEPHRPRGLLDVVAED